MDVVNNVRGRWANANFGPTVVNEIRRRVSLAHQAMATSPNLDRHVGALNLVADQVSRMDAEHPLLIGLADAHMALGNRTDTPFTAPGGSERGRVLSLVGVDGPAPDPDRVLAELVCAAFQDSVNEMRQRTHESHQQASAALAERDRVAPFEPRALAAEGALIDAEADARIAREERDQLQRQLDYLRQQEHESPESANATGQTAVEGEERIYRTPKGRFKVQPPDRPSRTFDSLPEAIEYRDAEAVPA